MSQILARRLNQAGHSLFADYVSSTTRDEPPPVHLLYDGRYTDELPIELVVAPLPTDSKYDLGQSILTGVQQDSDVSKLLADPAVWPWLSLYHSSRTMPVRNGKRFIGKPHRHLITNSSDWAKYDHGHRHLVRGAVQCVMYFGIYARVLLADAGSASKAEENILSRKSGYPLAYMRNAAEAYYDIHYDADAGRAGRGANSTSRGGIIHFVRCLAQLDVNYDIVSLPAAKILELLPSDFRIRRQLS
ncbi:hypothetical protein BV97_05659 [Novosphingobium resinovorum]|uniref:Uncharacterized protein n=1 Tax=Novosphingobium resinovorum TaxID=158500 RepID=A0A031J3G0_9SPHN|nr:hypothetical protein [Novosphingobium resinovorum]EZP68018.1 hypothetical protein BV97_05659 [Novosphingobium resinovorum]